MSHAGGKRDDNQRIHVRGPEAAGTRGRQMTYIWVIRALVTACGVFLGMALATAQAQTEARGPITLVIPYPAGGSTDQVGRMLVDGLSANLGRSIVIDNRSGGGGNVGSAYVAKATPDGSTILLTTNAVMTLAPFIYKALPFDPIKDFAPITLATQGVTGVAVNAELPIYSIRDLVDYAKQHPGQVTFGTAGTGSPHHIIGELINRLGGVSMVHVPYRGGGPMMNDLLGGHINVGIIAVSAILPQLEGKKIGSWLSQKRIASALYRTFRR